ncbi:hypothetical protein [Streptomyces sp. NBC_00102]|uniref:hypothetical protein n=1 Tax=Streptomyces sp. NBC_00102 TaxID=2975652 RepID=UPI0022511A84|nr:hypothetical protein [Streptomyces sp. NBC_00102]MCX5401753.1 hypothetical protein [Streptomyces sp. NBC_00102]
MYENQEADEPSATDAGNRAEPATAWPVERVMAWLTDRGEAERALRAPLGEVPSERDDRMARMADVLQATAQGLGIQGAAVWADVPEQLLLRWLADDQGFAAAVRAASALASGNGLVPGGAMTPATVRVITLSLIRGATFEEAARAAGLNPHRLRRMWRASASLATLMAAARHVRQQRRKTYAPSIGRPRGQSGTAATRGYRLVRRDGVAGEDR